AFIGCSSLDGMLMTVCRRTRIFLCSLYCGRVGAPMTNLPDDQHITYQLQYRKCGKPSCSTCRDSRGHGPYWYAYWREGPRLRSGYIGKVSPNASLCSPALVTT